MQEILEIDPIIGVPLPGHYEYDDLRIRVESACNTIAYLEEMGLQIPDMLPHEKAEAAAMAAAYAEDEEAASNAISNSRLSKMTPKALAYTASILDEYGHKIASTSAEIRNLVTNKLLNETENADPRVRLKALELLGKISDVGLFAEKTEVTVTHQTSDELKNKLRSKLEKLINPPTRAKKGEIFEQLTSSVDTVEIEDAEIVDD